MPPGLLASLGLSRHADHVRLLARSRSLAAGMSEYLVRQIRHTHDAHVALEQTVTAVHGTDRLESSMPGVFAVGDVRHRSVKRVASAVAEGGTAIQSVHQYLEDEDSGAPA